MLGGLLASLVHLPSAAFAVVGMLAVFGAAARVPIASLVMVTEMTGGYQLLPAAAFAVLASYLVQTTLSAGLKYQSLYEAQVLGRAQSPSRYVENVELALRLLGTQTIPRAAKIGHLDLVALLDSGVPVKVPGRKELNLGALKPESSLVGKTIQDCYSMAKNNTLEIIGIIRAGEIILPLVTPFCAKTIACSLLAQLRLVRAFLSISARSHQLDRNRREPRGPQPQLPSLLQLRPIRGKIIMFMKLKFVPPIQRLIGIPLGTFPDEFARQADVHAPAFPAHTFDPART